MNNRQLTGVSFAEFTDSDMRNTVLQEIRAKGLQSKYNDKVIVVKPALSQIIRERIWALNAAFDLVENHMASNGKKVEKKSDKDARAILVDGVIAFDQTSKTGLGTFSGPYVSLALPGRSS